MLELIDLLSDGNDDPKILSQLRRLAAGTA